jgi:hypothetical protein
VDEPTLEARFESLEQLHAAHERELAHGGLFVEGAEGLSERQRCRLVLVHPAGRRRLELDAEVVWVSGGPPRRGLGLQLLDFDEAARTRLARWIEGPAGAEASPAESANPYLRLRGLPVAEQLKKARRGEQQERVALERLYGKGVWEPLLDNPRITVPEVARIARKGTLPVPLLEKIVGNEGWVASPEVRRALLSNPRLRGQPLRKVLDALPAAELQLVEKQTAYPSHVREEARRRLHRR